MFPFGVANTQQPTTSQPSCSKPHWVPIGFEEAVELLIKARRKESAQDALKLLEEAKVQLCRADGAGG